MRKFNQKHDMLLRKMASLEENKESPKIRWAQFFIDEIASITSEMLLKIENEAKNNTNQYFERKIQHIDSLLEQLEKILKNY